MKKTISATLGTRVFVLEEDAYALLDTYLRDLKRHFRNEQTVNELMNDIETSIGEKFADSISQNKEAITYAHVEDVITVMGKPEEIADNSKEEAASAPTEASESITKRLYRDTDNLVLGGVASGLGAYFNVDPLLIRLIFILLTIAHGFGIAIYLILWFILPKAETTEQKLEMRGKPTNINELQELAKGKAEGMNQDGNTSLEQWRRPQSKLYQLATLPVRLIAAVADTIRRIFRAAGPIIRYVIGILFILGAVIGTLLLTIGTSIAILRINSPYLVSDLPLKELATQPLYYLGVVSLAVFLLVPLILAVIIGISCLRGKNQFRILLTSALVGIWIIAAGGVAASSSELVPFVENHIEQQQIKNTISRSFDVSNFNSVDFSGVGNLTIVRGDQSSLSFTGDERLLNELEVTVKENKLTIQQKPSFTRNCFFCRTTRMEGQLTLPTLTSYVGSDSTSAKISGFIQDIVLTGKDVAHIDVTLTGTTHVTSSLEDVSRLTLSGQASSLEATLKDNSNLILNDTSIDLIHLEQRDISRVEAEGKTQDLTVQLRDVSRLEAASLEAKRVSVITNDTSRALISPIESFQATSTDISRILYSQPAAIMSVHEEDVSRIEEDKNP